MLRTLALVPLALALVACSGAEPADTAAQSDAAARNSLPATEIVWDDLMPDGELERLEQLYSEFYDDFEQRMNADQQTLMGAANSDGGQDGVAALIKEGSADDTMEQIGTFNVVDALDGQRIRLPGYVVPFDFSVDATHSEFLLVPYFGACLHTPPPPPNQMLFVRADPPATVDSIYEPVWIEGTISTGEFQSELGDSAYQLTLSKIEPYQYQ